MTVLQSTKSFTPPPEQRGLCSTMVPIERHRSHRSSPGFDPGIDIKQIFFFVIAGLDPAIHPSKHKVIHKFRHSNAGHGVPHKLTAQAAACGFSGQAREWQFGAQSLIRHFWMPFANGLGFGAKSLTSLSWKRALSKNNRCSGCFYLQALCNILASKGSFSNRSEPRCLSWGELICPSRATSWLLRKRGKIEVQCRRA